MRIEPADDAMFGERDAWCYEPPYDFYDSDGLPVKNPEFFFAARDDDGTLIGFYFLEPRDGALFYGFGMRLDLTGRGLGEQFVVETFDGYGSVELIDMETRVSQFLRCYLVRRSWRRAGDGQVRDTWRVKGKASTVPAPPS